VTDLHASDALLFVESQHQVVNGELQRLRKKEREHAATTATCTQARDATWVMLASILVPSAEAPLLDAVARRLHLPTLASAPAQELFIKRKAYLEQVLAGVDADPRWSRHEALLNACDIHTTEATESLRPLQTSLAQFGNDAAFMELLAVGYGTDGYGTKWWRSSYYRHWKNADEVMERWSATMNAPTFARLRELYEQQRDAAATLQASVRELTQEKQTLQSLVARRNETVQALAALPVWWLETLRVLVIEHLRSLSDADRFALLAGTDATSEAAVLAAKKVSALEAKVRYLEQAREHWIDGPLAELQRTAAKLAKGEAKFRRKNARASFQSDEIRAKYGVHTGKWNDRWHRYDSSCHAIVVFDRYDLYDPYADLLWWDLMARESDERLRGNFLEEVELRDQQLADRDGTAHLLDAGRDQDLVLGDAS